MTEGPFPLIVWQARIKSSYFSKIMWNVLHGDIEAQIECYKDERAHIFNGII